MKVQDHFCPRGRKRCLKQLPVRTVSDKQRAPQQSMNHNDEYVYISPYILNFLFPCATVVRIPKRVTSAASFDPVPVMDVSRVMVAEAVVDEET